MISWASQLTGDVWVQRALSTPDDAERFLLTMPSASPMPVADAAQGPGTLWWISEIDAAVPTVFAATQEKFVPQMLNLEVLGGVDFKKGCYPGQEVVARSQYLGKLKRRMNVAHVEGAQTAPGADVFQSGGQQPIGSVVMAATWSGGTELLFEAPVDQLEAGTVHLHGPEGPRLVLRPLPYTLFDPTK
jgi:folate-binding protein YgfZ